MLTLGIPALSWPGVRRPGLIICLAALASACTGAQRDPAYYDVPTGNSAADAARQARNTHHRSVVSAPSQIQYALNEQAEQATEAGAHTHIVAQPQTYLGTLPCFRRERHCAAQRVTLTLAPNGRWRARVDLLGAGVQSAGVVEQGCWRAIPGRPVRLLLIEHADNVRAELLMVQSNMLRVRTVNGTALSLDYNLTGQRDLDPIDAVFEAPTPVCNQG